MQYTNLHSLLSKEDVIRFGKEIYGQTIMEDDKIKVVFDDKYKLKQYQEYSITKFNEFLGKYPQLEIIRDSHTLNTCTTIGLRENAENPLKAFFVPAALLTHFLNHFYTEFRTVKGMEPPIFVKNHQKYSHNELLDKAEEYFLNTSKVLKQNIDEIEHDLNEIKIRKNPQINASLEEFRANRRACLFIGKHLRELVDDFSQEDEMFFSYVNIDKLELLFAFWAYYIIESKKTITHESEKQEAIQFLERYFLLTEHLSERNAKSYEARIANQGSVITYEDLKKAVKLSYKTHKDLYDNHLKGITVDEILAKYLPDARRKLRKIDIEKHLQLNWNLVPYGKGERNLPTSWIASDRKVSESQTDSTAKDYELMKEKEEFYASTTPEYIIDGRNAYEGYGGYIYENGLVVLEKFKVEKRKTKEFIPVHEEGFVIMQAHDFLEMSKYSKTELMELISLGQNRSAKRKYHSKHWKENLLKLINARSEDYDAEIMKEAIQDILLEAIEEDKKKLKKEYSEN